ncbi:DNA recombination protein RmuC [Flavobacterium sp. ANB]|uniref:DNA recombination protein RmuC n=1 Tax=unclassified Flavobacterium TaxID=196869 RepID=UPI0012B9B50E|nr:MULTISPECIES: DNA recombination protein RmuC [unclassified Flavobacterium]MBF4516164.1 DNA recombination protein RmuC [Flavobacterium sp. ANB]MTD69939.1 DNA recombination protein RmuC [Flavobacterium sp. LC2016-13]
MEISYIIIGLILGIIVGWLIANSKKNIKFQQEKDITNQKYIDLDKEFVAYKATSLSEISTTNKTNSDFLTEVNRLNLLLKESSQELSICNNKLSVSDANLVASNKTIEEKNLDLDNIKKELANLKIEINQYSKHLATSQASLISVNEVLLEKTTELETYKEELKKVTNKYNLQNEEFAISKANNEALNNRLETQKKEIEELGKKFNLEFENIANKILDTKSEKFTELNKTNIKSLLEPLGQNINEFKKQVNEVYKTESNERFSLGEKVKELALLNQVISEEAKNLTKALKGEAKTQGKWGEMILESILERSGLRKNEQYFMEHELLDENGKAILSDSEGKKMRPDAVIKYPDNRNVILDSKVSLNAFTRLIASVDVDEQKRELLAHISAIKNHIIALSSKGYDDYDKALDFVMMFIPSEPAYIAALQNDPDLWNFAYDKRILLISPTNLITSLKLIVDLWKREYQNQNAVEIAERGAKLYDKFVGFVSNLESVGKAIDKAQENYNDAFKQLSTGNDNLVIQATKLKNLGLKNKKDLPKEIVSLSTLDIISEPRIEILEE